MTRDGQFFDKPEDIPENLKTQIKPSVFPPSEEEAAALNLQLW